MQVTDAIADMLTRIRNANSAKHDSVKIPASNMKKAIAQILVDEGIFTESCFAAFALRILVSISAIASVTCIIPLPP